MNIFSAGQDEAIRVLVGLGLTNNEAKVYLNLARLGLSRAKTISKAANVAREDIYRIMPTLQELGLVEKIVDTTSMYAAIPMREAFKILINTRKKVIFDLQLKAQKITQNLNNNDFRMAIEEETHEFILLPGERAIIKRKQMIDNAQKSIDFIISWNRFIQSNCTYSTNLRNALKKCVEIRVIVGKNEDEKLLLSLTRSSERKISMLQSALG